MPKSFVQKKKIPGIQAIEFTVDLMPYLDAYKNYKQARDAAIPASSGSPDPVRAPETAHRSLRGDSTRSVQKLPGTAKEEMMVSIKNRSGLIQRNMYDEVCASDEVSPKTPSASFDNSLDKQPDELDLDLAANSSVSEAVSEINAPVKPASPEAHDEVRSMYDAARVRLKENVAEVNFQWEDVIELAMKGQRTEDIEAVKSSNACMALADSCSELLGNAVDEALGSYLDASANGIESRNTLKATLLMTVDDKSNPDKVIISFVDNGRGFNAEFFNKVGTPEARRLYTTNKVSSNKTSEEGAQSAIPFFVGGQGQGLRMLMRKKVNIDFFNVVDHSLGKILGAGIHVTSPKRPNVVNVQQREEEELLLPISPQKLNDQRKIIQDCKQKNNKIRVSPLSIDTGHSDSDNDSPTGTDNPNSSPRRTI